ncbi:MAG: CcmD family protein [Bacteroidota bacterium]
MKKISNVLWALFLAIPAYSQDAEMADKFRADGKIYVLVSILVLILAGLISYLVIIDRKASRLEKRLDENKR